MMSEKVTEATTKHANLCPSNPLISHEGCFHINVNVFRNIFTCASNAEVLGSSLV